MTKKSTDIKILRLRIFGFFVTSIFLLLVILFVKRPFGDYGNAKIAYVVECRPENDAQNSCMTTWYVNDAPSTEKMPWNASGPHSTNTSVNINLPINLSTLQFAYGLPIEMFDSNLCGYLIGNYPAPVHMKLNPSTDSIMIIRSKSSTDPDCVPLQRKGEIINKIFQPSIESIEPNGLVMDQIVSVIVSELSVKNFTPGVKESEQIDDLNYKIQFEIRPVDPKNLLSIYFVGGILGLNIFSGLLTVYDFIFITCPSFVVASNKSNHRKKSKRR